MEAALQAAEVSEEYSGGLRSSRAERMYIWISLLPIASTDALAGKKTAKKIPVSFVGRPEKVSRTGARCVSVVVFNVNDGAAMQATVTPSASV